MQQWAVCLSMLPQIVWISLYSGSDQMKMRHKLFLCFNATLRLSSNELKLVFDLFPQRKHPTIPFAFLIDEYAACIFTQLLPLCFSHWDSPCLLHFFFKRIFLHFIFFSDLESSGWAKGYTAVDFELLCPDGTRAAVTEWAGCNLGPIPPSTVMTRPVTVTKIYDFLMKSQVR